MMNYFYPYGNNVIAIDIDNLEFDFDTMDSVKYASHLLSIMSDEARQTFYAHMFGNKIRIMELYSMLYDNDIELLIELTSTINDLKGAKALTSNESRSSI